MAWYDRKPAPRSENEALLRRIESLERRLRLREQTGPMSLQLIDFEDYEDDLDNVDIGEAHINWPGKHRVARRYDPAVYFHDGAWRALGSNAAVYEIKVFEDDEPNIVKDRAFVWEIPEDLDGASVMKAGAFVTTTGGSNTISITDDIAGGSVLLESITIPAGQRSSRYGTTPQAVGGDDGYPVEWGDQLAINTLGASGMGLGVWVVVVGAGVGGVALQGLKGDTGGITENAGNWQSGTVYTPGQVVVNNGITYVVTTIHVSDSTTEPGTGIDWEDYLAPLIDGAPVTSAGITISAGGYQVQPGIKGSQKIPYNAVIESASLLADKAGNVTVEIYKNTYASYPPVAGDKITGSSPLTLSGGIKTFDSSLTGWTTVINADDYLTFEVINPSVISRLTVNLDLVRS